MKCIVILRQVLNLFLALLLSNFGSSSLSAPTADQETNKIAEAFNRISRFKRWVKSSIASCLRRVKNKITNQISVQPSGKETTNVKTWNVGSVYVLLIDYRIDGWWFFQQRFEELRIIWREEGVFDHSMRRKFRKFVIESLSSFCGVFFM